MTRNVVLRFRIESHPEFISGSILAINKPAKGKGIDLSLLDLTIGGLIKDINSVLTGK